MANQYILSTHYSAGDISYCIHYAININFSIQGKF